MARDIEQIPDLEFFGEFVRFFGAERALQLTGWAFTFALVGVWEPRKLHDQLRDRGMTRSAIYRALADFRRFAAHLRQVEESGSLSQDVTPRDVCERLLAVRNLAVPSVG